MNKLFIMFKTYGIYAKVQFLYYQKRWLAAFFPNVYTSIFHFRISPPLLLVPWKKVQKGFKFPG